ncbi:cohesin subunit SA-3 [Ranitomeya imitator]|uniref:cohesin subunit SA-3 n=1 Tax=Ranitomeya imitator TaxID=111125 RepID=UPI0037E738F0
MIRLEVRESLRSLSQAEGPKHGNPLDANSSEEEREEDTYLSSPFSSSSDEESGRFCLPLDKVDKVVKSVRGTMGIEEPKSQPSKQELMFSGLDRKKHRSFPVNEKIKELILREWKKPEKKGALPPALKRRYPFDDPVVETWDKAPRLDAAVAKASKKASLPFEDMGTLKDPLDRKADIFLKIVDLKDAYYHVPIHEDFQKFLRVAVLMEGNIRHFQFRALPFGLSAAPRVFTKLVAEVMAHLRESDILIIPYLDDFLIVGSSADHCLSQLESATSRLERLGWIINYEKSRLQPQKIQRFLGLSLNSELQQCCLPPDKTVHIQQQATKRGLRHDRVGEELFEAIVRGRSAKQILVDDWLDSYKTDREPALRGLINFIIKACGCKGVVTRDMMATMQNADIIRKMTEDFDEDSADYPLSLSTKTWKKFRVNFGEFLGALVICCQHNVIYDGIFMDLLVSFVTGLSDSQVRAFRHTSTFAAMKLMTALVKVAKDLSHHLETSQRQFNVERAKSPEKRSAERLEALDEKMAEMYSSLEDIGNMMNGIFKGVFVHRYRDVHPDIRALCIEELGTWITNYPQNFLNDSYLKYLGWMLHDKQGLVRLQCLQSLHGLYNVPQWTGKLELFTSRFKSRIVAMALDKEPQVSAEAIHLIILISKCMENILSREDCESVHQLVYTTNRAVAVAAGEFLYQRILDTSAEEPSPEHSHRRSAHAAFFHLLIEFFISNELHDHAAYLVDSLWDSAVPQLRDWECQTDLLLMKKTCLDDQEESALINILTSSIRQAAEGTAPIGRGPMRKILSAKDKKTHSEDRLRLSRHMILTLPHLLAKFSADEDKMRALLKVVQYLELEIYSTERLEKNLDLLLTQVQDILEKHTEPQVLEACSCTLYILCDPDLAFSKRTDIVLSQLVDRLTTHFHNHLSDILQVMDLDEDDMYNTAATMKRLSALYSAHDLTRWELFDPCCHILEKAIDTSEVPEQIVVPALVCGHFSLLWELSHYSMVQPSEDSLDALQKNLVLFVTLCQSLLSDVHCSVREQTFILLSDLLVVFNNHVGHGERSYLQTLSYSAEVPLQAELAGFLVDHVFTNSEDEDGGSKIHRLHNRRVLLAGYCKMVLHNALELRFASEIFKYYLKYYTEYGDIIKETLHRIRRISKEESTRTILLSLTQVYTAFSLEDESTDRRFSPAFMEIRDLARRFALLLGPDQIRNRQDIVLLHKEGIQFCLQAAPGARWSPQNLLFLDVLSEFSPKLLTQDKAVLLHYLEEMCQQCVPSVMAPGAPREGDDIWALLSAYKRSLGTDPESRPATPSTRRAKERRQAHSPLSKKRRFEKVWIAMYRRELNNDTTWEAVEERRSGHCSPYLDGECERQAVLFLSCFPILDSSLNFISDDSSSSLADENSLMPLMSSTMLRSGAKATESTMDDRGGSDSDFDIRLETQVQ